MSPLQELQAKIIAAVPSIVELKFGCKLLNKEIGVIFNLYQVIEEHKLGGGYLRTELGDIDYEEFYQTNGYKILGRPILLEDIILTLEELNQNWYIEWGTNVNNSIAIKVKTKGSLDPDYEEYTYIKWLLNTPLHLQSEETISELNKLIK